MIQVIQGDITTVVVDAIVNAANTSLLGGGGVDGAIHRKGGPEILEACRKIVAQQGGCRPGQAVITTAGKLPARFVIHTVGPVWNGGDMGEPQILADCYKNSLNLALENNCTSVAFPNISTGIYRYPKEDAARIAVQTIGSILKNNKDLSVTLVCFNAEDLKIVQEAIAEAT